MELTGTVDLHMHSTASDGTESAAELLTNVRRAGIRTFSVTDHDTVDGALAMEALAPADMRFIRGVELSCATAYEKCHILGYGYDPDAPAFRAALQESRQRRLDKFFQRVAFLRSAFGITLAAEEVEGLLAVGSVGKPHLGALLAEKGYAPDRNTAIRRLIDPCPTVSDRIDAVMAVRAVREAGGVPVWAHPFGGTNEKPVPEEVFARQLALLAEAGLAGLECWYCLYTEEQVSRLLRAAKAYGLLISGGSDYHGANKEVPLGRLNAFGRPVPAEELTVLSLL